MTRKIRNQGGYSTIFGDVAHTLTSSNLRSQNILVPNGKGGVALHPDIAKGKIGSFIKNNMIGGKVGLGAYAADFLDRSFDSLTKGIETGNWDDFYHQIGEYGAEAVIGAVEFTLMAEGIGIASTLLGIPVIGELALGGLMLYGAYQIGTSIGSLIRKSWDYFTGDDHKDWNGLDRDGIYYQYDPLALDLNGNGIETLAANGHDGAMFDHERSGIRTATGWIHSNDGILVHDRNGDGKINDGSEIFGDNTPLKSGKTAAHGFAALAELDENGDGKVDAADSAFGKLGVWRDLNHNGISEEGELFTLKDLRIKSLNLGYTQADKDLGNGNTLAEVGSYTDEDGNEHIMGDLQLSADRFHSRFSDRIPLTDEQRREVNLRGSGRLRDLREAAAQSSELAEVLQQYKNAATKEEQLALRDKVLLAWADTDPQRTTFEQTSFATMERTVDRTGIPLMPDQIERMQAVIEMGFWNAIGQPDPTGQKQAELNRKIAILDAFTGTRTPRLYYTSESEARHIYKTITEGYKQLADSFYDGLLFQTRLRPYLDAMRLRVDEKGGYSLDYSGVSALFNEIHKKSPGKAFTDLGELLAKSEEYANKNQTDNKALNPLSEQFVRYLREAEQRGTLEQYVAVLEEKNLSATGNHLGTAEDDR